MRRLARGLSTTSTAAPAMREAGRCRGHGVSRSRFRLEKMKRFGAIRAVFRISMRALDFPPFVNR